MTPPHRREELYRVLGDLPPRDRPITGEKVAERQVPPSTAGAADGYVLETWMLDLNGIEPVPAYFTRPLVLSGRAPAVLYHHAHGGDYVLGKDEFINGRSALQEPPWQINALIAPRPHLSLAGNYDKLTPPAGLDRID